MFHFLSINGLEVEKKILYCYSFCLAKKKNIYFLSVDGLQRHFQVSIVTLAGQVEIKHEYFRLRDGPLDL